LIYFGQGFTHDDVYTMPTYLRHFYYKKLVSVKEHESKKIKEAQKKSKSQSKYKR
jgi:hypothetical protein